MTRVLITGGAGFIGSHTSDLLLEAGYQVRLLDNLTPQVHGSSRQPPVYLNPEAELIVGDVTDHAALDRALRGVDLVLHLASTVGVGQSMYDMVSYVRNNEVGTATLLEALAKRPVARLVVASSMSIYGEGLCRDDSKRLVYPAERSTQQLRSARWELEDANGQALTPVPTPESKPPSLSSVYALNKYAQERLCLMVGKSYGIPAAALRLFNVYGPRQALSNPYTGVLAIFASRLLNDRPPVVYEDGEQRRDFVHVTDVARAFRLALENDGADGEAVNIGSGRSTSVLEIAHTLVRLLEKDIEPDLPGTSRAGDIRHCFADVSRARELLEFEAQVDFEDGLAELAEWLKTQPATDRFDQAAAELAERGLTR